jgi:predicted HNH restriction endonuclease
MAQSVRIPVRVKIITERGNKCETCGLYNEHPSFFDLDHVIPIKRGRGHRYYKMKAKDEVIVLCPNCHRLKTISEDGFKK